MVGPEGPKKKFGNFGSLEALKTRCKLVFDRKKKSYYESL